MSCSMTFLTRVIVIAMGINLEASGWNILNGFIVLELFLNKTFSGTGIEKFLRIALEQFLEPIIRIFLKLFYNHYKYLLE